MRNQPGKNQQKWCGDGAIKRLRFSCKDCPVRLEIRKSKKLSQSEAKKEAED